VTLHLLLESDREEIPDVPAVYFVEPNEENIQRISDGTWGGTLCWRGAGPCCVGQD
jgi:hypothetical protein